MHSPSWVQCHLSHNQNRSVLKWSTQNHEKGIEKAASTRVLSTWLTFQFPRAVFLLSQFAEKRENHSSSQTTIDLPSLRLPWHLPEGPYKKIIFQVPTGAMLVGGKGTNSDPRHTNPRTVSTNPRLPIFQVPQTHGNSPRLGPAAHRRRPGRFGARTFSQKCRSLPLDVLKTRGKRKKGGKLPFRKSNHEFNYHVMDS